MVGATLGQVDLASGDNVLNVVQYDSDGTTVLNKYPFVDFGSILPASNPTMRASLLIPISVSEGDELAILAETNTDTSSSFDGLSSSAATLNSFWCRDITSGFSGALRRVSADTADLNYTGYPRS